MVLSSLLAFLKARLRRAPAGAEAGSAEAEEPPATGADAVASQPVAPDRAAVAVDAARPRLRLMIGLASLALLLLVAGGGLALLVFQRQDHHALRQLESKNRLLEQENARLRNQAVSIQAPPVAPAPAAAPPPQSPQPAAPTTPEPTTRPQALPRAPVTGECVVATGEDITAALRPCIDRFNQASARR